MAWKAVYVFCALSQHRMKPENLINPMYTGGLYHCYMLESSFVILGVLGLFCLFILLLMENPVSN